MALRSPSDRKAHTMETLFERVVTEPNTGCWLWLGGIAGGTGYGVVWHRGKAMGAHRLVYLLVHGGIPEGMDICHRCDVRSCINPDHLFSGTHVENMLDMVRKERRNTARGERNARAKVKDDDVTAIRSAFAAGESQTGIANRLGISRMSVHQIVRRRSWRHLE